MGYLPAAAKGKQVRCYICAIFYPERDFRMRKKKGKHVCRWCYDELDLEDIARQRSMSLRRI